MSVPTFRVRDKPQPDVHIQKLPLKYRVIVCSDTLQHAPWSKDWEENPSSGPGEFSLQEVFCPWGLPVSLAWLWRQCEQCTVQTPNEQALTFR